MAAARVGSCRGVFTSRAFRIGARLRSARELWRVKGAVALVAKRAGRRHRGRVATARASCSRRAFTSRARRVRARQGSRARTPGSPGPGWSGPYTGPVAAHDHLLTTEARRHRGPTSAQTAAPVAHPATWLCEPGTSPATPAPDQCCPTPRCGGVRRRISLARFRALRCPSLDQPCPASPPEVAPARAPGPHLTPRAPDRTPSQRAPGPHPTPRAPEPHLTSRAPGPHPPIPSPRTTPQAPSTQPHLTPRPAAPVPGSCPRRRHPAASRTRAPSRRRVGSRRRRRRSPWGRVGPAGRPGG